MPKITKKSDGSKKSFSSKKSSSKKGIIGSAEPTTKKSSGSGGSSRRSALADRIAKENVRRTEYNKKLDERKKEQTKKAGDREDAQEKAFIASLGKAGYDVAKPHIRQQIVEAWNKAAGNENVSTQSKATTSGAMAGIESLAMAYATKGKLDSEDYKKAGVSTAAAYGGQTLTGSDLYRGSGGAGQAAMSGAYGGIINAAGQYVDKGEVDWKETGQQTAKSSAQGAANKAMTQSAIANTPAAQSAYNAAYQQAISEGASESAAKAAATEAGSNALTGSSGAALGAGIAGAGATGSLIYRTSQGEQIQAEQEAGAQAGAMAGGAIGGIWGPWGAAAGAVVGGVAGRYGAAEGITSERINDAHLARMADGTEKGILFNPQTGKFEANKIAGVERFKYSSLYKGEEGGNYIYNAFPDEKEEQEWVQKLQGEYDKLAEQFNEAASNYDKEDVLTQLQLDAIKAGEDASNIGGRLNVPGMKEGAKLYGNGQEIKGLVDLEKNRTREKHGSDWGKWGDRIEQSFSEDPDYRAEAAEKDAVNRQGYEETYNLLQAKQKAGGTLSEKQQQFLASKTSGGYIPGMVIRDEQGRAVYDPRNGVDKREEYKRLMNSRMSNGEEIRKDQQSVLAEIETTNNKGSADMPAYQQPGIVNGQMRFDPATGKLVPVQAAGTAYQHQPGIVNGTQQIPAGQPGQQMLTNNPNMQGTAVPTGQQAPPSMANLISTMSPQEQQVMAGMSPEQQQQWFQQHGAQRFGTQMQTNNPNAYGTAVSVGQPGQQMLTNDPNMQGQAIPAGQPGQQLQTNMPNATAIKQSNPMASWLTADTSVT